MCLTVVCPQVGACEQREEQTDEHRHFKSTTNGKVTPFVSLATQFPSLLFLWKIFCNWSGNKQIVDGIYSFHSWWIKIHTNKLIKRTRTSNRYEVKENAKKFTDWHDRKIKRRCDERVGELATWLIRVWERVMLEQIDSGVRPNVRQRQV